MKKDGNERPLEKSLHEYKNRFAGNLFWKKDQEINTNCSFKRVIAIEINAVTNRNKEQ